MPTDNLPAPTTTASAQADDELPSAPDSGPGRTKKKSALRPLLLRLHFYAGILVAPFLLVTALTGLLYLFTPQLEQAIYARELHVPAGQATQPLAVQVDAARAALPSATLSKVRPGPTPTDTTQVLFSSPELPESYFRTVFVNPYNGEIRGILDTYGSSQALPVRTWLSQLHRSLHLGDTGRLYSELAASWLWVVVLGGLLLWWQRRRNGRKIRSLATPDLKATGRRRTMSWHAALGTWVGAVLLFLSATGLSWSQYGGNSITALREAMRWGTPTVSSEASHHGGHSAGGHPTSGVAVGPDQVLAATKAIGIDAPVEVTFPADAGSAYVVKQVGNDWPTKQDAASVDPATGEVTEVLRFADYPLMAKLTRWGIDAHMGRLFGLPNQLALAAVVLALLSMIVLGYRMWWQRRPTKRAFGRPMPRGAWRNVPLALLVPLVLGTALVGWFLLMFGIPLAVFLVTDSVLGWLSRRRAEELRP